MEKSNLDKSLTSKDEEKRMEVIGEKAYEQKYQELEIYMVCMQYYLFIFSHFERRLRNFVKVNQSRNKYKTNSLA
jgi:hypothetical protein